MNDKKTNLIFIAVGVISFIIAFAISPTRAWHGYLMNYYFISSIALGGIFFVGTQHLTNAGWSATVRRIPEGLMAWFPWAVILFLPLLLGGKSIYQWMDHQKVASDHLLAMKTAYLNVPGFLIRTVAFFAMWYFIGGKMVKNSLKQDQEGGLALTESNTKLSAIFMPIFAILFSFFSVDLIMSLDPHWFSTMFGVNCFANLFLSCLTVLVIITVNMYKKGAFEGRVNENHIQNLGLLMFAFVIFYAYIAFCQMMLIWYANLPEETQYYLKRWDGGWSVVAMTILVVKFIIPFVGMLPRKQKRDADVVKKWAYWILGACWIDMFWMVMPNYSSKPFFPIWEIGIFLGFWGAFKLVVQKFYAKHPTTPLKDPRLPEALHYHQ